MEETAARAPMRHGSSPTGARGLLDAVERKPTAERRDRGFELLVPKIYADLRRLAQHYLRDEPDDHTLQATALVHEAFLRLSGRPDAAWKDRAHFIAVAAREMRRVLIDHARRRRALRRGGGQAAEPVSAVGDASVDPHDDWIVLDEALTRLGELDPRKARVVELRFFGGLTIAETAQVLGTSPVTVVREWRLARAWLQRELGGSRPD